MTQHPADLRAQLRWLELRCPAAHAVPTLLPLHNSSGGTFTIVQQPPATVEHEIEKFNLLQKLTQTLAHEFSLSRHRGSETGMVEALQKTVCVGLATHNAELLGVAYCRLGDVYISMNDIKGGIAKYETSAAAFAAVADIRGEFSVLSTLLDVLEVHLLFAKMTLTLDRIAELERRMPHVASNPLPEYLQLL